jgi:hypothetical protein
MRKVYILEYALSQGYYLTASDRWTSVVKGNLLINMSFKPSNDRCVISFMVAWRIGYFVEQALCRLLKIMICVRENKVSEIGFPLRNDLLEIVLTFKEWQAFVPITPNP